MTATGIEIRTMGDFRRFAEMYLNAAESALRAHRSPTGEDVREAAIAHLSSDWGLMDKTRNAGVILTADWADPGGWFHEIGNVLITISDVFLRGRVPDAEGIEEFARDYVRLTQIREALEVM